MIVLIPAYEPDQKLVDLVTSLRHCGQTVVVVDDGSGPGYQPVFQQAQDTQTGLRGYPAWMLGWLQTIEGDRFEYELEVFLAARRAGVELHEVPIATIYLEDNASSHFHPVRDSIRVYVPFLKFSMSSLAAFGIDATLFFGMMAATGNLAASVVSARLVSASLNFALNHRLVFAGGRRRPAGAALRYGALVVALMAVNYALLSVLNRTLGLGIVLAKLLTEVALFVASYQFQQRVVFPRRASAAPDPEPGLPGSVDAAEPALPQLV